MLNKKAQNYFQFKSKNQRTLIFIYILIIYEQILKINASVVIELLEADTSEIYQKLTGIHLQIESKTNEIREFIKENFN